MDGKGRAMQGTIARWDDDRGFGFVTPDDGGPELFLHIKAVPKGALRPRVGDHIAFEGALVEGRWRVTEVTDAPQKPAPREPHRNNPTPGDLFSLLLIPLFVGFAATFHPDFRWWILYAIASAIAFAAFAVDKRAAEQRSWRIPESTLHVLEVLGGWPGAMLGSQLLRHKTTKNSYRCGFWVCTVFNVAAFVVLNTVPILDVTQLLD